jgi:prepilin-type N-terminal cleavage/methylation domain-containing protein
VRPDRQSASKLAHSKAAACSSAFTLIELMAVVLIMAVVVTIAVASLPGLARSMAVTRGARQVADAYELARQTAITTRTPCRAIVAFGGPAGNWTFTMVLMKNTAYASSYRGYTNSFVPLPVYYSISFGGGWAYEYEPISLPQGTCVERFSTTLPGSLARFPAKNYSLKEGAFSILGKTGSGIPYLNNSGTMSSFGYTYTLPGSTGTKNINSWVEFNPLGQADITSTVRVYEAILTAQGYDLANTNSPNWADVITEAGSGRIRIIRP